MKIKISLCLSHKLESNANLSNDSHLRLKKTSEIFFHKNCDFLMTTGWKYENKFEHSLAGYMAIAANEKFGVPLKKILKEERSKDTVGEAVFSKLLISELFPDLGLELFVITSDWHLKRAQEIFEFIYADENINLSFETIPGGELEAAEEVNNISLELFRSMMTNCKAGNTIMALDVLKKRHKLYKQ